MHLKRLHINGFKSFAARTSLDLAPGVSAIVGPNGSGKSNIADAIRWTLGEQSGKSLRLKKSEDLVFAGTEKRAKGSMAEVTLVLDNDDGAMPLDFSEIEITRTLLRNGENEYRLNGSRVRLSELQQLLVAAGFGPNSYSVIAQGMIDSFILATPSERKLLFDEASGIRGHELKREQAMRKLAATEENLVRLRDILGELEPRLTALAKSAAAAQRRQGLEEELAERRRSHLAVRRHHAERMTFDAGSKTELSDRHHELTAQVAALEAERDRLLAAQSAQGKVRDQLTAALNRLEVQRDKTTNQLSMKRAQLQFLTESRQDDAELIRRLNDVVKEIEEQERMISDLAGRLEAARNQESAQLASLETITQNISSAQAKLSRLRRDADPVHRQEYVTHALSILKQIAQSLARKQMSEEALRLLVHKAGRLLSHASQGAELTEQLRKMQSQLTTMMRQREEQHEVYTNAVIQLRSLEIDLSHAEAHLERLLDRRADLAGRQQHLRQGDETKEQSLQQELSRLEAALGELDGRIAGSRAELADLAAADHQRSFTLAEQLEAGRTELARLAQKIEELSAFEVQSERTLAELTDLAAGWGMELPKATPGDPVQTEKDLLSVQSRLEAWQEADRETLEEYAEVKKRYEFLSEQVVDLEAAKQDLVKVVSQLEGQIQGLFETAFSDIAESFRGHFERLFGGGRAELVLKKDETGFGIEIVAIPPGKRVTNLSMLSGGERSLTGIALLAAILSVNPSPFVVLDEVDAALDEANSRRFADILADIGQHSQLLVITHNRSTMAAAHSLFGVTMDDNHISSLLSVRLEQAREMAGRPQAG